MRTALITVVLTSLLTTSAVAQSWIDDFNDGSVLDGTPVLWTPSPAFASQFAVVNGDLVMNIPAGTIPAISSARVPANFPNGASVRARMKAFNAPGRFTVAFADQPTGIQGYVASFSSCGGGRIELFRGDAPGVIVFLGGGPVPWTYSPEEEFLIQLDVFEGIVSARVWKPGEVFPAPQILAADRLYPSGVASIAIQDFGQGDCIPSGNFSDAGTFVRFAQASSSPLAHSDVGDASADGVVDVQDLLQVIGAWGPCPQRCELPCAPDVAPAGGDCTVDVVDLLAVIGNWG